MTCREFNSLRGAKPAVGVVKGGRVEILKSWFRKAQQAPSLRDIPLSTNRFLNAGPNLTNYLIINNLSHISLYYKKTVTEILKIYTQTQEASVFSTLYFFDVGANY